MTKEKLIFLLIFIAVSCQQSEPKKIADENYQLNIKTDSIKREPPKDTLAQSISALSDTMVLKLKIDNANKQLIIPLKIRSGKELFASLSSNDQNANIRFTQVALPDSSFDGPFGRDLHYALKKPGNYQLIIGENMMAGDKWEGEFVLRVWIK